MNDTLRVSMAVAAALFISSSPVHSQQPAAPPLLDSALVSAFQGAWHCTGAFANGKKIESTIAFTVDLDRHWLRVVHDDLPPNGYHAQSMWGADGSTGRAMSMIFDNFGGARKFTSSGWNGHGIVFDGAPEPRRERFTYAVESPSAISVRYEVSGDAGATWKLGDALGCRRT